MRAQNWPHTNGWRTFAKARRRSLAGARLFYLFGPHEDPRRLVPSVTLALLSGRVAATTAGKQLRDFLHVDDVATALVTIAETRVSGPVNIASGRPVRVRDVVLHIGMLTGSLRSAEGRCAPLPRG